MVKGKLNWLGKFVSTEEGPLVILLCEDHAGEVVNRCVVHPVLRKSGR